MTYSVTATLPWPGHDAPKVRRGTYVDPWLAVCDRCPLPDCIRLEGDLQTSSTGSKYPSCPVWVAQSVHGWTAKQALVNAGILGLREAVTWLEF